MGTTALGAFALSAATGCSVPAGSRLAVVLSPDDVRVVVATCGECVDGVHAWFGDSNATDAIDVPLELLGEERRSTVLLETSSDGTIHESRLDPQRWAQRACDD